MQINLFSAIQIFLNRAGYRVFIIFLLIFLGGITEMFGVSMIAPALSIGAPETSDNTLSLILNNFFTFLGLTPSLTNILLLMIAAFIIKGILTFSLIAYSSYTQTEIRKNLQKEIINSYSLINYQTHQEHSSGYINNIIVREVPRFLQSFMELTRIPVSLVHAAGYLTLALVLDWMSVIALVLIGGTVFLCIRPLTHMSRKTSLDVSEESSTLQSSIIEYIQNILYFRATASTRPLTLKLGTSINKFGKLEHRVSILSAIVKSINEPIAISFMAGIIYFKVIVQEETITEVMVLSFLLYRLLTRTLQAQGEWQRFCSSVGGLTTVNNALSRFSSSKEQTAESKITSIEPQITFKNVSVSHGKQKALNSINIDIPSNKSIGIVGPSGAGKTTFFNVLTGLLDAEEGEILLGKQAFNKLSKDSLRQLIGFVPQEPIVLNDTMLNNIVLWRLDTKKVETIEAVHQAMKEAGCDNLIPKLNETLGERGMRLSGGEKQRLAIARELLKRPQLLIMDEATSALDSYSEEIIQESINALKGKCTILLIAHRLSTVKNCDIIYVFKDGKVIESGTFKELHEKKDSFFYSMCHKQGILL